jgi:hypothetical protein
MCVSQLAAAILGDLTREETGVGGTKGEGVGMARSSGRGPAGPPSPALVIPPPDKAIPSCWLARSPLLERLSPFWNAYPQMRRPVCPRVHELVEQLAAGTLRQK